MGRLEALREWGLAAAMRAVKSAAQAGLLALGTETVNMWQLDWVWVLGMMGGGAVLSLLMSLAGIPEVDGGKSPLALREGGGDGHSD